MTRCTDPTCTPVKHDRSDHLEPEGTELGRFWDERDREWLEAASRVLRPTEVDLLRAEMDRTAA